MMGQRRRQPIALIVEDDPDLLHLAELLLEESEFDTIGCDSAEAALAIMLLRGHEVTMVFADIRLSGVMDGVDLARELKARWPSLNIIMTSGNGGQRLAHLPPGVEYMAKPWRPLDVIIAAERARA